MSGENFGNSWGQYPSEDAEVWQRIAKEFESEHPNWREGQEAAGGAEAVAGPVAEEVKVTEAVAQPREMERAEVDGLDGGAGQASVADLGETSPRDVAAQSEQREMTLDEKLAVENRERLKQSAAEMVEFERKMQLSPAEYWQDLRNKYATEGVDLGLMPDVRGLQETAEDYFWESDEGGKQAERVGVAVRAELEKMAQAKAEEIRKWQSEGRGLPITYENEWLERGQRDMLNTLNSYYGDEGRFNGQIGKRISENEEVAWQMATLPQRPGELSAMWTFQTNPWMFEGETMVEYYNRLKNYRRQDLMREWQVKQDEGKKLQTREVSAEELQEMVEQTDADVEELRQKREKEEQEAIRETDEEIERMRAEREAQAQAEETEGATDEAEGVNETESLSDDDEERVVRRRRGLKGAIRRMMRRFKDAMKLKYDEEDAAEDAAYYDEMERLEAAEAAKAAEENREAESIDITEEGEENAEDADRARKERWKEKLRENLGNLQKMTAKSAEKLMDYVEGVEGALQKEGLSDERREKLEASRDEALMYLWGYQELEKERQEKAAAETGMAVAETTKQEKPRELDMEAFKQITPEEISELRVFLVRSARELERGDLSEELRQRYENARAKAIISLEAYQQLQNGKTESNEVELERKEEQAAGEYALEKLKEQQLISGEFGEKGYRELTALKAETETKLLDAIWNEDEEKAEMYEERLHFIKRALPLMISTGEQAA